MKVLYLTLELFNKNCINMIELGAKLSLTLY